MTSSAPELSKAERNGQKEWCYFLGFVLPALTSGDKSKVVPLAIEIAGVSRVRNTPRAGGGGTGLSAGEAEIIRGIGPSHPLALTQALVPKGHVS
ncbi:unnamed protein product [Rangifer tarandus platyrhynchus]|uniref:Uncharacterized protein n=2 Tax=Rangifer tarandus platyrhynchus TaxID=3082113 RepID=A0ACB0F1K5_RANTA|nr:unnamed protein product [Rangifer tarandus platyrhynchus]CAI9706708.1 unnamed protein product [Rangifer tarandus platyrhynchus]